MFNFIAQPTSKVLTTSITDKDAEQLQWWYIADVNGTATLENSLEVSYKITRTLTIYLRNPTCRYSTNKNEDIYSKAYKQIFNSFNQH